MIPKTLQMVCLPGWMFPPYVFQPLRSAFAEFSVRQDPAWLELPWTSALDLDGLRRQIAARGPGCVLLAWSLGAMAALQLAADPPPGLCALVLLGATARLPADAGTGHVGVAPAVLAAMRRRLHRDPAGLFHEFHGLCRIPAAPAAAESDTFVAQALAQEAGLADAGLAALSSIDLRPLVSRIRLPITLLHGMQDAVVPVAQAQALAHSLPCGRVLTLPGCGHLPGEALLSRTLQVLRGEHDVGGEGRS